MSARHVALNVLLILRPLLPSCTLGPQKIVFDDEQNKQYKLRNISPGNPLTFLDVCSKYFFTLGIGG